MTSGTGKSEDGFPRQSGVSFEAVSRIVDATGVPLKDSVQLDGLRAALDRLLNEVTVLSLSRDPRGARRELERLKRAFETYQDLADQLPAFALFPPKPPAEWRAAVTLWIKNTDAELRSMKGQTRSNALAEFYPRAIGLFAAAFAAEITVWHDAKDKSAPIVKFAEAVIIVARDSADIEASAGRARVKAGGLQNPWIVRERDAIRVGLRKALGHMPGSGPGPLGKQGYAGPSQPSWASHRQLFTVMLDLEEAG
ncbi:hypothetical protein R5H30_14190 [Sulfitobacter sp. D35]|uniref:hypothetical protein n=1 Tax=Sulfitobacter sp. D35 TaxID=3083252 RepID=UPI00296E79DE|nr:hypothetical protein [Sulfitobacter sp. D35]MDW4499142.1 hypothetical protein [Sulfitobacter sp. D35]